MKCFSALKRNELLSYEKTWKNLKCMLLSERSQSEKPTYWITPIIVSYSGKSKTMKTVQKLLGIEGREGSIRGVQRIFRAIKLWSCNDGYMSLYICPNPQNIQHHYRHWLIMMCQCRFIDCNKCTILVQDVYSGGGCVCGGTRVHGNALYFLCKFAMNLKLV